MNWDDLLERKSNKENSPRRSKRTTKRPRPKTHKYKRKIDKRPERGQLLQEETTASTVGATSAITQHRLTRQCGLFGNGKTSTTVRKHSEIDACKVPDMKRRNAGSERTKFSYLPEEGNPVAMEFESDKIICSPVAESDDSFPSSPCMDVIADDLICNLNLTEVYPGIRLYEETKRELKKLLTINDQGLFTTPEIGIPPSSRPVYKRANPPGSVKRNLLCSMLSTKEAGEEAVSKAPPMERDREMEVSVEVTQGHSNRRAMEVASPAEFLLMCEPSTEESGDSQSLAIPVDALTDARSLLDHNDKARNLLDCYDKARISAHALEYAPSRGHCESYRGGGGDLTAPGNPPMRGMAAGDGSDLYSAMGQYPQGSSHSRSSSLLDMTSRQVDLRPGGVYQACVSTGDNRLPRVVLRPLSSQDSPTREPHGMDILEYVDRLPGPPENLPPSPPSPGCDVTATWFPPIAPPLAERAPSSSPSLRLYRCRLY